MSSLISARRTLTHIGYRIRVPSGWNDIQLLGKTASGFVGDKVSLNTVTWTPWDFRLASMVSNSFIADVEMSVFEEFVVFV